MGNGNKYCIRTPNLGTTRRDSLTTMKLGETIRMIDGNGEKTLIFNEEYDGTKMKFSIGGGGFARFDPNKLVADEAGRAMDPDFNSARIQFKTPVRFSDKGYVGRHIRV
jgi:hypothetical protein